MPVETTNQVTTLHDNGVDFERVAFKLRFPNYTPLGDPDIYPVPLARIRTSQRVISELGRADTVARWRRDIRSELTNDRPLWPDAINQACGIATLLRLEDSEAAVRKSVIRNIAVNYLNVVPVVQHWRLMRNKSVNTPLAAYRAPDGSVRFIPMHAVAETFGVTPRAAYLMVDEIAFAGAGVDGVVRWSDMIWLAARQVVAGADWAPADIWNRPKLLWAAIEARKQRPSKMGRPATLTLREFKLGVEAVKAAPAEDRVLWLPRTSADEFRPLKRVK